MFPIIIFALFCTRYLALNTLVNGRMDLSPGFLGAHQLKMETSDWWFTLPWLETFKRFLTIPPISVEDQQLLICMLQFLNLHFNMCYLSDKGK